MQMQAMDLWLRVAAAMWLLSLLLSDRPCVSGASAVAPDEQVDLPTTPSNEQQLQDTTSTYRELQSRFDEELNVLLATKGKVNDEIKSLAEAAAAPVSVPPVDDLYDAMDGVSTKVADLVRRTKEINRRVREYNLKSLQDGQSSIAPLLQRLNNTLNEETRKRDSYLSDIEALESTADEDGDSDGIAEEVTSEPQEERQVEDERSSYISIADLNGLLSEESLIQPSEVGLVTALMNLANEQVSNTVAEIQSVWDKRVASLPLQLEAEFATLQESVVRKEASGEDESCLAIPRAVELVQQALVEHYNDGTGAKDYAAYENGGTIVHELTSSPYVPPPRNGDEGIAAQKQRIFDAQAEALYWQQRSSIGDPDLSSVDLWDIYTSFKFEARQYLPDDWERLMDSTFGSWDESTPRGTVDALTPDYVYHSLGLANDSNFGSAYGRTASADAPITTGQSKSGDATGWSSKPMGSCYPLSMQADDDPVLAMFSREMYDGSNDVFDGANTEASKLITGPKLTVRLPHAIHIDAVTLEHRSFPVPPKLLQQGLLGGESAPRWVRVVGYPPCGGDTVEHSASDEDDEESCSRLGFDVDRPIDLGTIEYERITVTGRGDDYGAGGDDEETQYSDQDIKRRRSIQTFVVKGGNKQTPLYKEAENEIKTIDSDRVFQIDATPEDDLPPGSCAPPKEDEMEPSCGGDRPSGASPSSPRQIVEAVSFIIEENWGGAYTCLYRVRVHGEPL